MWLCCLGVALGQKFVPVVKQGMSIFVPKVAHQILLSSKSKFDFLKLVLQCWCGY